MSVLTLEEHAVLIMGLIFVFAYVANLVLKYIRVPNVVSFLLAGFVLSNFIFPEMVQEVELWFDYSESVALGLIGFAIGTELNFREIMGQSRRIALLLVAEAGGAFVLVYFGVLLFSGDPVFALILGGIATATAPAATVEVIRKTRAEGEMTTILQWLLAFDDLFAIFIVEAILAYLKVIVRGDFSVGEYFVSLGKEMGLAMVIGLSFGIVLDYIVEKVLKDQLEMMEFTLAVIIFTIGLASYLGTSEIITTMSIGMVVTNRGGDNYSEAKDLLEVIIAPIIAIFFVLVGARIGVSTLVAFPLISIVYLFSRSVGKYSGLYVGSTVLGMRKPIRNNLGLGLMAQGGVALGMASEVEEILGNSSSENYARIGHLVATAVVISTVFSEILGAVGTQLGLQRVGEVNKASPSVSTRQTHLHD